MPNLRRTVLALNERMNLQNWYRKQDSVVRVWLILITFSMIVIASCANEPLLAVAQKQRGDSGRTFADWCREKDSLSPEAKHTVEMMLEKVETTECNVASQKLSTLTELQLVSNQISDIKPLASLTNLTVLVLNFNQISDIKPLASLTNLNTLYLANNQISDIKPLASLTNLEELLLSYNQISDIKPLASLINLESLSLEENKIADLKPLVFLTKLEFLWLNNNQIVDIKPLESLTNLYLLSLGGNPITPKTCPLKPEYICHWKLQN